MYQSSNFLGAYSIFSKVLNIYLSTGKISFLLSVCNYQKSTISGNEISIVLENTDIPYKLTFSTSSDAIIAYQTLRQAIDLLKINCASKEEQGLSSDIFVTLPTNNLPIRPVVNFITTNSARINWTSIPNAIDYNIEYYEVGKRDDTLTIIENVSGINYNLTNLNPSKPYYVSITANF